MDKLPTNCSDSVLQSGVTSGFEREDRGEAGERERGEIDPRLLLQSKSTKKQKARSSIVLHTVQYLLLTLYVWSFPVSRLTAQGSG